MIKINFRQPKYIFPLVVFVPLCAMVYFLMQTFGGVNAVKLVLGVAVTQFFILFLFLPERTDCREGILVVETA